MNRFLSICVNNKTETPLLLNTMLQPILVHCVDSEVDLVGFIKAVVDKTKVTRPCFKRESLQFSQISQRGCFWYVCSVQMCQVVLLVTFNFKGLELFLYFFERDKRERVGCVC